MKIIINNYYYITGVYFKLTFFGTKVYVVSTKFTLSICTDKPEQTLQTKIRHCRIKHHRPSSDTAFCSV